MDVVLTIHDAQLAEHGGAPGIRDQALLESALARPRKIWEYSASVSLNRLAAAYAVGLAKNHGFVDGNKRIGWVTCAVFLALNGTPITVDQGEVVAMMLGVSDGSVTEKAFTEWLDSAHPNGSVLL